MIMNIDIPEEMKKDLEQRANKLGTSMSYLIKDAIYRYLKNE